MKKYVQFILCIFCYAIAYPVKSQQNLVSNPGFEELEDYEYTTNRDGKTRIETGQRIKGWFGSNEVHRGSKQRSMVDYHNNETVKSCRCTLQNNPNYSCDNRTIYSHSGKGKTGMQLYMSDAEYDGNKYRQRRGSFNYLETKLTRELKQGQVYYLEFYIYYSAASAWGLTNLGALLTSDTIVGRLPVYRIPQVVLTNTEELADGKKWIKVSGNFKAAGGERILTIGTFAYKAICFTQGHGWRENGWDNEAYYYFDDFLLTENKSDTIDSYLNKPAAKITSQNAQITNYILNPGFETGAYKQIIKGYDIDSLKNKSVPAYDLFLIENNITIRHDNEQKDYTTEHGPQAITEHWYQPLMGTPDLYPYDFGHTGRGKVGMILYTKTEEATYYNNKLNVNYILSPLSRPLQAGKTYYLEFYTKLDARSRWRADNIGVYFTADNIVRTNAFKVKNSPQLFWNDTASVGQKGQWHKLCATYKADGTEKFMTIGCFYSQDYNADEKTNCKDPWMHLFNSDYNYDLISMLQYSAYYYFDDFLLTDDPGVVAKAKEAEIKPINVTLLVDVSNSMYKSRHIDSLKTELMNYVKGPGKKANITLVTYGTKTEVLWYNKVVDDINAFQKVLDGFHESGATLADPAIAKAFALADSVYNPTVRNEVIMFTDAVFELNKKSVRTIKRDAKDLKIEFAVYQYGNHENPLLQETLKECQGYYSTTKKQDMEQLIAHRTILKKKHHYFKS